MWEVAIKAAAGRLPAGKDVAGALERSGLASLPIAAEHAWAAAALPRHHGDPFDRMLVAQAQLEGLTLVTRDGALGRYQVAILPA